MIIEEKDSLLEGEQDGDGYGEELKHYAKNGEYAYSPGVGDDRGRGHSCETLHQTWNIYYGCKSKDDVSDDFLNNFQLYETFSRLIRITSINDK